MNWALGGIIAVAAVWMLLRWAVRLDRYEQRIERESGFRYRAETEAE